MSLPVLGWFSSQAFVRPECKDCTARMLLKAIEPYAPGIVQRRFECECGQSQTLLIQKPEQG